MWIEGEAKPIITLLSMKKIEERLVTPDPDVTCCNKKESLAQLCGGFLVFRE